MKVGDQYKVYIEVSPGHFEPVAAAAIKSINKDDNQVQLIVPATLITMDTRVEIDTTPQAAVETGNAHVVLGVEDSEGVPVEPVINSGGATTPGVINQPVETPSEGTSAPVEGTTNTSPAVETPSVETVTPVEVVTPQAPVAE